MGIKIYQKLGLLTFKKAPPKITLPVKKQEGKKKFNEMRYFILHTKSSTAMDAFQGCLCYFFLRKGIT